jgi:hypothetical protein
MSTITRYARGAAAFTRIAYRLPPTHVERPLLSEQIDGPSRSWDEVIDELLALRGLEDDWDGQGAQAPEPALVDTALSVATDFRAERMPPAARAVAGVNGTVVLEWYSPTTYLEIEVTAPGQVEGRFVDRESGAVEEFTLAR